MVIKRVVGWPFQYGGIEHTGWLPPGAAQPLPTPRRKVLLDVEIEGSESDGYLLIYRAQDGSFWNDDWFRSLNEAETAAENEFGIPVTAWQPG